MTRSKIPPLHSNMTVAALKMGQQIKDFILIGKAQRVCRVPQAHIKLVSRVNELQLNLHSSSPFICSVVLTGPQKRCTDTSPSCSFKIRKSILNSTTTLMVLTSCMYWLPVKACGDRPVTFNPLLLKSPVALVAHVEFPQNES